MCFIIESYERFNIVHIADTSVQYKSDKDVGNDSVAKEGKEGQRAKTLGLTEACFHVHFHFTVRPP